MTGQRGVHEGTRAALRKEEEEEEEEEQQQQQQEEVVEVKAQESRLTNPDDRYAKLR